MEDEPDNTDDEDYRIQKNFMTQRELMILKEQMEDFGHPDETAKGTRLSPTAIEEIHRLYLEGSFTFDKTYYYYIN